MMENPKQVIILIAASLPSSTVFFINVIITQLCIIIPLRLLRWINLIQWLWVRYFTSEPRITARTLFTGPLAPSSPDYDLLIPSILFVLLVVVIYWVIAPIVLPFASLFFIALYFMYKYQSIFVFERRFDTGGIFFYSMYKFAMTSLFLASILNIAYVFIKNGNIRGPLLMPLPFIIVYFWRRTESSFKYLSEQVAFSRAVKVDERVNTLQLQISFTARYFCQPELRHTAVGAYPHRKGYPATPLINPDGSISKEYWEDRIILVDQLVTRRSK